MSLGLGIGLSFLGGDDGGGAEFTPGNITGVKVWLRADLGITFAMGAVVATGTAPPAVTLTGISVDPLPIEIDLQTTGILGVATFQWKLGTIVQQVGQITTATFPLGTTGLTANFPVGAYVNDNVYVSTPIVSAWTDQSGQGNSVSQGTASKQPAYTLISAGTNGQPSLSFAASAGQELGNNGVTPVPAHDFTMIDVCITGNSASTHTPFACGGGEASFLQVANGSPGTRGFVFAGIAADADSTNSGTLEVWVATNSIGDAQTLRINGTGQALAPNNTVSGARTAGLDVGNNRFGGGGNFYNGRILELIACTPALSAGQLTQLSSYMQSRYGQAA